MSHKTRHVTSSIVTFLIKTFSGRSVKLIQFKDFRTRMPGSRFQFFSAQTIQEKLYSCKIKCLATTDKFTLNSSSYSSLPNRRVARNKRGSGKDEPFIISVVPGISMVVRMFRSVTVIKRRTKWIEVSN